MLTLRNLSLFIVSGVVLAAPKPVTCKESRPILEVREANIDRVKSLIISRTTAEKGHYVIEVVETDTKGDKKESVLTVSGNNCTGMPSQTLTCKGDYTEKKDNTTYISNYAVTITSPVEGLPIAAVRVSKSVKEVKGDTVTRQLFACPEIHATLTEKAKGVVDKVKGWIPSFKK